MKVISTAVPVPQSKSAAAGMLPIAALLAAVLLWGTSFAAMKSAVGWMDPFSVMWARMAVASLILAPLAFRLRPRNTLPGDWKLILPMVLLQPCLYFLLESNALRLTTSAQAGVISATVPLLVAFGAATMLREKVTRRQVGGLVFSLLGVVVLTAAGRPDEQAVNPVLGNIMEFGAMLCAAGYMLLLKHLSPRYNPWTLTGLQALAGAIFFLPGAPGVLASGADLWSIHGLNLLYLGAFVTLGAFGLYNWGISKVPAARASAFINLIPVVALMLGWTVMGESLNPVQVIATAAVIAGVYVSQRGKR
jgi:drug/metabolite transporter (DMT)-like permease